MTFINIFFDTLSDISSYFRVMKYIISHFGCNFVSYMDNDKNLDCNLDKIDHDATYLQILTSHALILQQLAIFSSILLHRHKDTIRLFGDRN